MHYQIREPRTMKPTFDTSDQKKKLQENENSRIQPSKQMSPKVTENIITPETPISVTKGEIDEKRG